MGFHSPHGCNTISHENSVRVESMSGLNSIILIPKLSKELFSGDVLCDSNSQAGFVDTRTMIES